MFGSKPFGATTSFGSTPRTTFGSTPATTATGSLFGQPLQQQSTLFGSPASKPLFGTPTTTSTISFATPASTGSLFGQQAAQPTSLFGATTQPSLFGTSSQQPATNSLFGQQSNSFAQQQTQPAFGGTSSFGQATGGLFGQQQASPFGAATTGLFGAKQASAVVGTTVQFNPKLDSDTMLKNNIQQNIQTKHQCITAMKEYESKSLEELRVEDYLANRKGPSGGQAGFTFGSSLGSQPTGGLFGTTTTTTTVGGSLFGQSKPLFGGTTFGSTPATTASGSLFGQASGSLFGASAAKPFFGAPTTTSAISFATPASTGGLFGQQPAQPTNLFGATTQPSLFGTSAQQPAAGSIFGQSSTGFGQQQTQPAFGTATPFGQSTGGVFGQQQAAPFGAGTTGLFGTKPTTTSAPAFGSGFGTTTGFGTGFGATTQPSLFGTQPAQQQKPLFGGFGTQQPAFGTAANTSGGLFGTTPFGATGQQNLFGNQQQAKPGLSFGTASTFGTTGLTFGNTGAGTTDLSQTAGIGMDLNMAIAMQEALKTQLFGLSTSPYGDRTLPKGRKSEETSLPLPTDPLAQKRILDMARSSTGGLSSSQTKPLPPFKPATRLLISSPGFATQSEMSSAFQGIDRDTISFTEGFIPKRNIKKLVLKPKDRELRGGDLESVGGPRSTSIPENNALTTSIRSSRRNVDNTAVRSLNFDTSTYSDESDARSDYGQPSFSALQRNSNYDKENVGGQDRDSIIEPPVSSSTTANVDKSSAPATSSSPCTVSSSVQTPSSADENVSQRRNVAGIILTRPDYFTVPSMSQLENMADTATGNCVVNGFTVGRTGYGSVFWPGETNVAGLNLDHLVHFRHKEVTVYPDDDDKPQVGMELNKEAEITLERVWPIDKTTRLPIKDVDRLNRLNYRDKLEKATAQMNADFLDYRPETGAWVFKVPHFSKYGLAEEADEEQPSMMELETVHDQQLVQDKIQRLKPKQFQKDAFLAQRAVVDIGFSLDADSKGLGGIANEQMMTDEDDFISDVQFGSGMEKEGFPQTQIFDEPSSFYSSHLEGNSVFPNFFRSFKETGKSVIFDELSVEQLSPLESSFRQAKRKPLIEDVLERSLLLLGKTTQDTNLVDLSDREAELIPSPLPSISTQRADMICFTRPRNSIRLVPYTSSISYALSNCWLDASLYNGRRCRVGWAPLGILALQDSMDGDDGVQTLGLFSGQKNVKQLPEFTISLTYISLDYYPISLSNLDNLLRCQYELFENNASNLSQLCQVFPCNDGPRTLDTYKKTVNNMKEMDAFASVIELTDALWGFISEGETREELLTQWITDHCRVMVNEQVELLKRKGKQCYVEAAFCLLTSRRVEEAAELAREAGDNRLSLVIAQLTQNNAHAKALYSKQLSHWFEVEADKYVDTIHMKVYALAAGVLQWKTSDGRTINTLENLDWKRALGMHLWYAVGPVATIYRALKAYDVSWKNEIGNGVSIPPYADYELNSQIEQIKVSKFDIRYHLLRLFVDASYPIYTVLEPSTWTLDPFDFHLSWHLWCILHSLGLIIVERGCLDTLHVQYAFQLERRGLWQRGIFVAMHINDPCRRMASVKQILAQHSKHCSSEDSKILVDELGVPGEWL